MFVQVTAKNVGGVFLRHSVYLCHLYLKLTHSHSDTIIQDYEYEFLFWLLCPPGTIKDDLFPWGSQSLVRSTNGTSQWLQSTNGVDVWRMTWKMNAVRVHVHASPFCIEW